MMEPEPTDLLKGVRDTIERQLYELEQAQQKIEFFLEMIEEIQQDLENL